MRFFNSFSVITIISATFDTAIAQDAFQNRDGRKQIPFGEAASTTDSCDRPPRTTTITEVIDRVTVTVPAGGDSPSLPSQHSSSASDELITLTTTSHHTRYMYEVVETKTMVLPPAMQTDVADQKGEGCDKTACESCLWFYGCENGERACIHCRKAPFCSNCESRDDRPIVYEQPVIDEARFTSGRFCSLPRAGSVDCSVLKDARYKRVKIYE